MKCLHYVFFGIPSEIESIREAFVATFSYRFVCAKKVGYAFQFCLCFISDSVTNAPVLKDGAATTQYHGVTLIYKLLQRA